MFNIFRVCSGLTTITIPNSVTLIWQWAFAGCTKLENVYCYAENVPSTTIDVFQDSYIEYATLHVPAASVNAYKAAEPWKNFKQIVAIDGDTPSTPKCAKPTISYDNLKLTYSCETEGVEYISEIKDADIKKYYDNSVSLSATYEISVYATKSGYDNSDVATATLVFTNATFTAEGTSSAKSANVNPVLIQANNGIISVEGADDGERINVYTPAGSQEGTAISQNRLATINTHIKPGDIAIIKKTKYAENGEIVAASIGEDENYAITLKHFYHVGDRYELHPANSAYKVIVSTHCEIHGKLLMIIRQYGR